MNDRKTAKLFVHLYVCLNQLQYFYAIQFSNSEDFHWQPFSIVYSILVDMLSLKVEQFLEKNDKIITALQKKTKIKQDWMTG